MFISRAGFWCDNNTIVEFENQGTEKTILKSGNDDKFLRQKRVNNARINAVLHQLMARGSLGQNMNMECSHTD